MTRKLLHRSPSVTGNSGPLYDDTNPPTEQRMTQSSKVVKDDEKGRKEKSDSPPRRCGEMVGGAVAECTAVCCCCPFTVMDFLVLAVIKVPAGLCKKAHRKRKLSKRKKQETSLLRHGNQAWSKEELEREVREILEKEKASFHDDDCSDDRGGDEGDMEKEMWKQFDGTGFWRRSSAREEVNSN